MASHLVPRHALGHGLALVALLALSPVLTGQRFSASATTATPVTLTCSLPGQPTQTRTVPAGTPAQSVGIVGLLNDPTGTSSAFVDGRLEASPSALSLSLQEDVLASGAGAATTGPHELLLTAGATVPTPVRIEISWTGSVDPGAPAPVVWVDIGDDQVLDFLGLFPGQQLTVPVALDASPLAIRTHTQLAAPGGGSAPEVHSTLRVTIRADLFGTIQTVPNVQPCGDALWIEPDLEQHLRFQSWSATQGLPLPLLVLGFRAVGLQLPGQCLLWPDPDIVAPIGPAGLRVDLQLPQASGLNLVAQAVSFWPLGQAVRASGAYSVQLR